MRFIVQRVAHASVTIEGNVEGAIDNGFMVLIGIRDDDTKEIADKMVDKLIKLRIFEDENGKSNIDLDAVSGGLLLISQFTLYADCKKGNRPSYIRAAKPDLAIPLYDYIVDECKKRVSKVETGVFGADMKVELLNDGPFTIVLDSDEIM
ncbi:D-tyrosyl-tRNA(Tyr) deacylase [Eubacterium uniforme]|uniref:D-aminoacyl-tRNA deacylase n=1 Tax=Eubacterium uniforme TaxID=39495 RepID=A0A1T4VSN9_9FIRM|nr:D-aminoacyl-tRNA deacylase [Eubacterium uniforme]SKA67983.1 D-tyrosyl-tRNA(Tyr) deacylase [Eubacterium uniforme]